MSKNGDSHPAISRHELRRVAVAAMCDPRSVVRYLNGDRQVSTVSLRIEIALRQCDHAKLVRDGDARPARPRDSSPPPPSTR